MALFKILRGSSTSLSSQPYHDGYAYFTPDTGCFYIDVQLDTEPAYFAGSGTENGKTVYRIELESEVWSALNNTKVNKKNGLYYVAGTQTAATNVWKGNLPDIDDLFDGLTIAYYLPFAGTSTEATLTLTLKNKTTSAIPVYYTANSRAKTQYGQYSVIILTYINGAWRRCDYNSDTNYYHTTGSWDGLTYTATANGGADALAFTIPTGTTATTVAVGNHNHDDAYVNIAGDTMTGALTLTSQSSAFNDKNILFTDGGRIGGNISGDIGIYGNNIYLRPNANGNATSTNGVKITSTDISPSSTGGIDLGTSSLKYGTVYATTFNGNATSADKLATARYIDGVSFNGSADITHYGTCSTGAGTAAKTVAITGFALKTGAVAYVKFNNTNTANSPTLNINGTGAKNIYTQHGFRLTTASNYPDYLIANKIYQFVYNGTNYIITNVPVSLELYEPRTTTTSLNKAAIYGGAGAMFHMIASSSTTEGKPPTDANVLQMNWDNNGGYDAQIAVGTSSRMWYRSKSSTGSAWNEVVTSTPGTATGSATQPVYINSTGVPTVITSYEGNAATATKATQDASGNIITNTYATKDEVNAITAESLGLSKALKFIGFASSGMSDGQTTVPTITGVSNYSPTTGDVVIDSATEYEYVYTSANKWERLGGDSSYALSDHTHGNINNNGSITSSGVALANGDYLLFSDASNNGTIERTNITFDGTTATKALTQKGTWETFNNYSHPTYTATTAAAVKVGNDATGHVVIGDALTAADVGVSATTTSVTVGSTTFNQYVHPTTAGNKHIPTGGSAGQFLGYDSAGTAQWVNNPNTDTLQNVTLGTTTKAYLTGVSTAPTATAQAVDGIADTGVYLTTVAGELNATQYKVNEAVTLQYNSTTKSLDFIFA